jgi:hypothetical protein
VVTTTGKAIIAKRLIGATPAQAEPFYCAMGTGATGATRTAVVGDTALSTQVETRTAGTPTNVTVSTTNDTYQVVGAVSATTNRAVDEAGLFDASTSGTMFTSATFNVLNLVSGDSITFTWKVSIS